MVDSMSSGQGSFQEHGREQSFHLLERELSLCLSGGDGEVCFVQCQVCFILATFLLLNLLHFFFFFFHKSCFLSNAQTSPLPPPGFELWLLWCLLSVSDVPANCASLAVLPPRSIHISSVCPPALCTSCALTKRTTLRVVAHFFQENQQVLFSVLNKLLSFDMKGGKSICA